MPIRTDDPVATCSSTVLLVEDRGLCEFLPMVLEFTSIVGYEVNVVGGGGWTEVYRKYDELVASGIDAGRIIPVLDADTLGQKGPRSAISENQRIFRFPVDFELSFAAWECRLLDHALLLLRPGIFGTYGSVSALKTWTEIVDRARIQTVQPGNKRTTLDNVVLAAKSELSGLGQPEEGLVIPSKVELAKVLAELCIATGAVPPEVAQLLLVVEAHANGRPKVTGYRYSERALWGGALVASLPLHATEAEGKVLFSPNGCGLKYADLSASGMVTTIPGTDDLGWGLGYLTDV